MKILFGLFVLSIENGVEAEVSLPTLLVIIMQQHHIIVIIIHLLYVNFLFP